MKKVGIITHYYGQKGVAIVELSDTLKVGDKIKIEGGGKEFEQVVESMQIEHENVDEAGVGKVVGLKVSEKAKEGAEVYKAEE